MPDDRPRDTESMTSARTCASVHAIGGDRLRSSRDRACRRDPCRRAGHTDAFGDAEAAARGVRPADHRLAGGGGAGGRRRARWSWSRARSGRSMRSLDGQVTVAVQQEPRGTADAVKAAAAYIDPADTVIVLNGDHPLVTAETLEGLARGARPFGRGGDAGHRGARGPERVRTGGAGAGRHGRAGGRDQGARRRDGARAADPRDQHGHLRLRGRGADRGAGRGAERQRAGRAVPARRAADHARARAERDGPRDRRRERARRQRPGGAGEGQGGGAAADPRAPHAGRGDDRRPGDHRDRRRRADRPGHRDRPVHEPARRHRDRRRRHRSARCRRSSTPGSATRRRSSTPT